MPSPTKLKLTTISTTATPGAIKDGGACASVRGWRGPDGGERDINFHVTMVFSYDRRADLLDEIHQQVEDGQVTMRVNSTYPAEQGSETHRLFKQGGHRGRFVITFD